jgi:hypothetical protein
VTSLSGIRYASAHLDDLERLSAFGEEGVWRPVRHHFGIEGFGVNAYTAERGGDRVIEEHDELAAAGEGRHQELYVVLTGRAQFTLDDERIDAPAGTFVFVGEPDVRRGAIATDPHTSVLAVGARPGVAFDVSAWEHRFRARAIGGAEGVEILADAKARLPDNATIPYDLACMLALAGNAAGALDELGQAIALEPKAREWAAADEDLAGLRGTPAFEALLAS